MDANNNPRGGGFFALLFRQKYITRWGLMRCTTRESLSDHSFETAVIAHALAMLTNSRYGGDFDCDRAAVIALYHDASEVYTGDMPTPVKYHSEELRRSYKQLEKSACEKLLSKLPDDIRESYREVMLPDDARYERLVKAADKLAAYIKCAEEERAAPGEFSRAMQSTEAALDELEMEVPAVRDFRREILPSFALTLDEL